MEADKAEFEVWSREQRGHFEGVAEMALDARDGSLGTLTEAMRYAVLDGGKRMRAMLVYAAGRLTQARESDLDELALAVEYVHGYSLVHDDMPAMDNDVLRATRCSPKLFYALPERRWLPPSRLGSCRSLPIRAGATACAAGRQLTF